MTYRRLGRTALKVGPIAVGSVNFGWNTDEAESFAMLNFALGGCPRTRKIAICEN